jgi:AcrR family transcriptional regulator
MDEHENFREAQHQSNEEALAELFLQLGVVGTSKDMVAKTLNLTRRELDRRFTGKVDCILQIAQWFGTTVWQQVNQQYDDYMQIGIYTGAELLERYMIDIKKVFLREPRWFIFYAECKTFLFRYSCNYKKKYAQLLHTIGCRERIAQMISLGQQDGSLQPGADIETEANYFYRAFFGFLFNMALSCGDEPREAADQIDRYISRVVSVFRKERGLPQV